MLISASPVRLSLLNQTNARDRTSAGPGMNTFETRPLAASAHHATSGASKPMAATIQ